MLRPPHFGALVSIELRENTREAAFRFMDALSLCVRSTSLGDVFTGVLHPATASHREVAPKRRLELGITEGLVRISVGIEDIADIIADIEEALSRAMTTDQNRSTVSQRVKAQLSVMKSVPERGSVGSVVGNHTT